MQNQDNNSFGAHVAKEIFSFLAAALITLLLYDWWKSLSPERQTKYLNRIKFFFIMSFIIGVCMIVIGAIMDSEDTATYTPFP